MLQPYKRRVYVMISEIEEGEEKAARPVTATPPPPKLALAFYPRA
jgi:hypothetical protein